jgi:hypothetical protein
MLNKFPVTSSNGVDYLVEIEQHHHYKYIFTVTLFKKRIIKLFNKEINIPNKMLYSKSFGLATHLYSFQDVKYLLRLDYIEMTKMTIKEFEDKCMFQDEFGTTDINERLKFYGWNGKCK